MGRYPHLQSGDIYPKIEGRTSMTKFLVEVKARPMLCEVDAESEEQAQEMAIDQFSLHFEIECADVVEERFTGGWRKIGRLQ